MNNLEISRKKTHQKVQENTHLEFPQPVMCSTWRRKEKKIHSPDKNRKNTLSKHAENTHFENSRIKMKTLEDGRKCTPWKMKENNTWKNKELNWHISE